MQALSWSEEVEEPALSPALPFVLGEDPSRVPDRSATRALEVVQLFGDAVVDVRHLVAGATLVLGRDLPAPDTFVDGLPVARHDGSGWVVQLRGGARLLQGGDAVDLADVDCVRLGDRDQLVLELDAITLVFREVWKSRRMPVPLGQDVDVPFLGIASIVGVLAALGGWFGSLMPTPTSASSTNEWADRIVRMTLAPKPPPPPPQHGPSGGESTAGGAAPALGRPHVDPAPRPAGHPAPAGLLAALDDSAIAAILGDSALPSDIRAGVDSLIGGHSTDLGAHGIGGRCVGPDCRGAGGTVGEGIGDVGTHGRSTNYGSEGGTFAQSAHHDPVLRGNDVVTIGNIDKADVDRVIKKNMSRIRYCYQRELQKAPDLSGKVKIKFVIAADGTVASAVTSTTTLNNPAAESCITHVFSGMQFTPPRGGGIAIVSYPFLFSPG